MNSAFEQGRRAFLKASVAAGGGLIIGFYLPGVARLAEASTAATKLNSFLQIGTDGKVTFFCGQAEMGQGAHNALAMMIAEELEVDFRDVRIEQGGVDPAFGNPRYIGFRALGGSQATGGSSSVRNVGVPVRRAGAAARTMLIAAAAEKMKVSPPECVAEKGWVIHKPSGQKVSYGAVASEAAKIPPPTEPALKRPAEFKIIGKATKRYDIPLKVNGKAIYGIDVKRPGLLTAVVARCPVLGGKVKSFNADGAMKLKGVKKVVQISSGVAVVADNFWAAKQGRDALKVTWDEGPMAQVSSPEIYQSWAELAKGTTAAQRLKVGDVGAALASGAQRVESIYEVPFLAHACMEPMNATVHFKGDSVEIWAPTQAPSWNQHWVSQLTGLKPEAITIHTTYLGGGFGRRLESDYVVEAVETSRAAGNVPVKVAWTREDDTQHSPYRPASLNVLSAALDAFRRDRQAHSQAPDRDRAATRLRHRSNRLWLVVKLPEDLLKAVLESDQNDVFAAHQKLCLSAICNQQHCQWYSGDGCGTRAAERCYGNVGCRAPALPDLCCLSLHLAYPLYFAEN